jgi:hypothetical protein
MRRLLPATLLLFVCPLFPLKTSAQTASAAVDCKAQRLSGAEQVTCADPELVRLTSEIDALTKRLESTLTGSNRAVLVDTEGPFTVQRNNCQNERPKIRECVEHVLTRRRTGLTAAMASPSAIRGEITQYRFLSISFFQKYGDALIGRRVNIFGCMVLDPGPSTASRLHGFIRESCTKTTGPSVSVFFNSMNETQALAFDSKTPTTHWDGVVGRRDGKLIFLVESST